MVSFYTNLGGRLGSTAYELSAKEVVQRSDAGERRMLLANVIEVRLNQLAGVGVCELRAIDGSVLNVSSGRPEAAQCYVDFIARLHQALDESSTPVRFIAGSWLVVALFAAIASVAVVVGALIIATTPLRDLGPRAGRLLLMAGVMLFVGPLVIPSLRPRTYDPTALPQRVLPRVQG